jgi:hypothetical protein
VVLCTASIAEVRRRAHCQSSSPCYLSSPHLHDPCVLFSHGPPQALSCCPFLSGLRINQYRTRCPGNGSRSVQGTCRRLSVPMCHVAQSYFSLVTKNLKVPAADFWLFACGMQRPAACGVTRAFLPPCLHYLQMPTALRIGATGHMRCLHCCWCLHPASARCILLSVNQSTLRCHVRCGSCITDPVVRTIWLHCRFDNNMERRWQHAVSCHIRRPWRLPSPHRGPR